MKQFIKMLNKYAIIFIINALFGMPWLFVSSYFLNGVSLDSDFYNLLFAIPTIVSYLTRIILIIMLIIDMKNFKLRNIFTTCVVTLFAPALGVSMFFILYIYTIFNSEDMAQISKG